MGMSRWIISFSTLVLSFTVTACTQPKIVKVINPSPVTTMNLDYVPWCQDEHGNSLFYPCKWDSNIRPVYSWAPGQLKVAVWVRRHIGCPVPLPEDVTCFWAPVDQ